MRRVAGPVSGTSPKAKERNHVQAPDRNTHGTCIHTVGGRPYQQGGIWSLVLSILTLGGIGSIAGIWLGVRARGRIDQTGERGRGLALAGIIVGVITLLFAIGYWVYIAKYIGGGHGGGGGSGGGGGGGY